MTKYIKKFETLWNDKRAEFSSEVSQKEKDALFVEITKNEQQSYYTVL